MKNIKASQCGMCGRPTPGQLPYLCECGALLAHEFTVGSAAAALGRKGGAAGRGAAKRRDVDYAALGRKGAAARKAK